MATLFRVEPFDPLVEPAMHQRLHCFVLILLSLLPLISLRAAEPASTPALPAWIKPAFERGLAKVEFYDPAKPPPFPGWTEFEFEMIYRFDYDYRIKTTSKKKHTVTVLPKFTKIEFLVKHRIQLPQRLDSPDVWKDSLAQHELDHVAIGAHRRVELLADHLIRQIRSVEATVDNPKQVTDDWVSQLVRDEIAPRRNAMDELIKANNKRLDKLTGHGARSLDDRDGFFDEMYLKENLDEVKFPYLTEVLDLLKQPDYQSARWEALPAKSDRPER